MKGRHNGSMKKMHIFDNIFHIICKLNVENMQSNITKFSHSTPGKSTKNRKEKNKLEKINWYKSLGTSTLHTKAASGTIWATRLTG